MSEKENVNASQKQNTQNPGGNIDYILFLILILLLAGNQNTFDNYFQTFNNQVNQINQVLNIFSATAEGLSTAVQAPQKVMENSNN